MKFPKFLFVKEVQDGDIEFLDAEANPELHAELGQRVEVAKYQLIEKGAVTTRAFYTGDDE